MGCCTGEKIDFEDLRTPEQKAIMAMLGPIIQAQMKTGATPYSGMLSAPYDVGQIAAMNTMMGLGGYGGYNAPQMPLFPIGMNGGLGGYGSYGNYYGGKGPRIPSSYIPSEDWWKYDPYNPDAWQGREKRKK